MGSIQQGDKSGLCGHAMKPYFHGAGGKNFNCRAPDVVQRFIGTATVIAASVLQTKIAVRKYNLLKQELTKKLYTNCRWVSSIAVHPRGIAHCIIAVFWWCICLIDWQVYFQIVLFSHAHTHAVFNMWMKITYDATLFTFISLLNTSLLQS